MTFPKWLKDQVPGAGICLIYKKSLTKFSACTPVTGNYFLQNNQNLQYMDISRYLVIILKIFHLMNCSQKFNSNHIGQIIFERS